MDTISGIGFVWLVIGLLIAAHRPSGDQTAGETALLVMFWPLRLVGVFK